MAETAHEADARWSIDYDLDRVRGFSDAVFAVAITIVVISFVVPPAQYDDAAVRDYLLGEWPRYLSYLAAFAVIGYTWMIHHQLFERIRRVDTAAIWINFGMLAFVVLTPYPMQLLGHQPTLSAPYVLFNLDAFLFGLINFLLVLYATDDHRLVSRRLTAGQLTTMRWRAAVFPVVLGLATVVAVAVGAWSVTLSGLVPLGRWLVRRRLGGLEGIDAPDDAAPADETIVRAERLEEASVRSGRRAALASVLAESGSLTRLIGFSDNVYAFAITLLVVQFSLPAPGTRFATDAEMWSFVVAALHPNLSGFFIGFAVVGLFWTIHHRYFLMIDRQDAGLRAFNLVHLMFIAVMPFATLVLSSYDRYTSSTVLYALCAGMASASAVVVFSYASIHHRLVDATIPPRELATGRIIGVVVVAGFVLSIPVALASPTIAQLMWLIPFVGTRTFRMQQHRRAVSI